MDYKKGSKDTGVKIDQSDALYQPLIHFTFFTGYDYFVGKMVKGIGTCDN